MFAKVKSAVIIALVALPMLANATAIPRSVEGGQPSGQCNTSSAQCCNQVGTVSELSDLLGPFAGLLALFIGPITNIGLNCSPLSTILGQGSANCKQVCCDSNFNGFGLGRLIPGGLNIGCLPLGDLGLPLKK